VGYGKGDSRVRKPAISLKRLKMERNLLFTEYMKLRMILANLTGEVFVCLLVGSSFVCDQDFSKSASPIFTKFNVNV